MGRMDPRTARTRSGLRAALVDLTKTNADGVTVTALCEAMEINRGTFYLHYSDVEELAVDVARTLVADTVESWQVVRITDDGGHAERSRAWLASYLSHVELHRDFYSWVLGPTGSWQVISALTEDFTAAIHDGLRRFPSPTVPVHGGEHARLAAFLSGALLGTIADWVASPQRVPADQLAGWLWRELAAHPA